jgi:hypothetical protein
MTTIQSILLHRRRTTQRYIALLQHYRFIRNSAIPRGIDTNVVDRILSIPTLLHTHCRINHHLYDMIRERVPMEVQNRGQDVIRHEQQIAIFLLHLSRNTDWRTISILVGVSESTAHSVYTRFGERFRNTFSDVVRWPTLDEQIESVSDLQQRRGIIGAIGAIDGTHIRFNHSPPTDVALDYMNRHGFYSINMLASCDHRGIFTDVMIGWPGRAHDARLLYDSNLYNAWRTNALTKSQHHYLLGDAAFPLCSLIHTPYADSTTQQYQKQYNISHSAARKIIERAFGLLKERWRYLHHMSARDDVTRCNDILNCVYLHNIIERNKYTFDGDDVFDNLNNIAVHVDDDFNDATVVPFHCF